MLICASMYQVPKALAPAAWLPGLAFEALVRLRNRAFSADLLRRRRLSSPVVSVGNITMGGAGKTPLAVFIARIILDLGKTPAILSRGYGRGSRGMHILPPGKDIPDPATELGDEPAWIRREVPQAWMGVSRDRFEAGRLVEKRKNGIVFILDDGFQHRALFRDLDVVIVDPTQPLEANRVFPRGSLREPVSELRRCHAIVINGSREEARMLEATLLKYSVRAQVFRCEQKITAVVPFSDWANNEFVGGRKRLKTAFAVAALGNPSRFIEDLARTGIEVKGKRLFADHHTLSRSEWDSCCEQARRNFADAIVITEKDAIKLTHPPDFPLTVAVQSTEIFQPEAFESILKNCIGSGRETH